jgi:branched-chain amino acid transport system permease protein
VTTLAFGVTASSYFLVPNYLPWFVTTQASRPSLFGHSVLNADWQIYYFCAAGFFLVLLAVRSLRQSRTGRALIATRDNEPAARAAAVNTTRQKLIAFAVSGAIAGFAGSLFAVQQQGINSGSFTADINIAMFSMVVIGGLGSTPGVILGAAVVWSAQYFLPSGYAQLVNGLGILLLLIFLPEGIGGLLSTGRDWMLRTVARRRGITSAGIWRRAEIEAPGAPSAPVAVVLQLGQEGGADG